MLFRRCDDADQVRLLVIEHLFEVRVVRGYAVFLRDFLSPLRAAARYRDDLCSGVTLKNRDLYVPGERRSGYGYS